jgi:hypothetical protein
MRVGVGNRADARDNRRKAMNERVMQQLVVVRRFMQQPLMVVLGVLTGAGAAKSGHGAWAAGGILTFFSIYFGAVVTLMATRSLGRPHAAPRRGSRPVRSTGMGRCRRSATWVRSDLSDRRTSRAG